MGNLQIVSFNLWQVLISLANLTLLYLGLKKFLYKPVKAVLENRKAAIAKSYEEAEEYRSSANAAREEYAAKLATAHTTADEIIHDATVLANKRGEKIVAEAHQKADEIVRQGELEASMEKKKNRTTRLMGPPPMPRKEDRMPSAKPMIILMTGLVSVSVLTLPALLACI